MIKVRTHYFLFVILALSSCGTAEVDVEPPIMEVNSYIPSPVVDDICGTPEPVVFRVSNNDELTFDVVFKDNDDLSQYKIDIHNNFDCHGHGDGSQNPQVVPNVESRTEDWTVLEILGLSGSEAPVVRTLTVPDNVTAGNYHFHIQVIDASGNDSPFANFNSVKVKNLRDTIAPVITAELPSTQAFTAERGQTIRFAGQVTDNRSLSDGGNGVLFLSVTDLTSGNTLSTDKAFPFDAEVAKEYDFDFEYTVPLTFVSRTYRLSLGANDGVRNVAPLVSFEVEVL